MSGVFKAVGKIFTKVAKAVVKFAPAILAVGAVVFTAGAALGLAPLSAGWGGAVASVFGTGSTISNVITGAVTQAGYGAAIGGAASMIGGGSFTDGAGKGALIGAVGGGLAGGMGYGTDALGGFMGKTSGAQPGALGLGGTPGGAAPMGMANAGIVPAASAGGLTGAVAGAAPAAGAAASGGFAGLLSSPAVGTALAGAGQGLMQGLGAKEAAEQQEKARKEKMASYTLAGDQILGSPFDDPTQRPTPGQAYDRTEGSSGRYVYNRETGQIDYA